MKKSKIHELKSVVANGWRVDYFAVREKNDRNGNPRYRVWIIDESSVIERIFCSYNLEDSIISFIERGLAE